MAKKLTMPKTGTAPAPSPMHNMIHNTESETAAVKKSGEENKRTTILVNPVLYRKFKVYATETGQTVTGLINEFMEDTLAKADK